jgi:hypothetical protein
MRTHHTARRGLAVPALGLVLAAAIAACSSSSSSSSSTPASPSASAATSSAAASSAATSAPASPTASASSSAATGTTATTTIAKNWMAFFDGKTPAATKITLVQDGQKFATVLKAQQSSAQSQASSASVQKVTLTSATQATVEYTILISGTPVLAGQKGTAVLENGTWKVSLASFCGLLALQNGGKPVSGCPTAG